LLEVYHVKHNLVVLDGHENAAKLEALHKLLELDPAIMVDVEPSKGLAVVFKLLLKPVMNSPEKLLGMLHFEQLLSPMRPRQLVESFGDKSFLHSLSLILLSKLG